ncbi:MAG: hypothetical protein EOO40_00495 [Deltaproteobacteria bacterium]|nr:MAG: hypothetical protein EOO40_00495 [Deltaproteobacteria bacterium]
MINLGELILNKQRARETLAETAKVTMADTETAVDTANRNETLGAAATKNVRKMPIRLPHDLAVERAVMVYGMIKDNKRNSDIRRACLQQYQSEMAVPLITAMRQNKYIGPGQELINKPRQHHTTDSPAQAANDHDVMLLKQALTSCKRLMRRAGVSHATIDATNAKAKVEIRATQTWDL